MDLTPRHIQDKQFNDTFRGYAHEEVDQFLDQVAESFNRIYLENQGLNHRIKELGDQLVVARGTEDMLKRTLLAAQKTADEAIEDAKGRAQEIEMTATDRMRELEANASNQVQQTIASAEQRARDMLADAQQRAEGTIEAANRQAQEIVGGASRQAQEIEAKLERLRRFEIEYRSRLRAFAEQQLKAMDQDVESTARPPAKAAGAPAQAASPPSPAAPTTPGQATPAPAPRPQIPAPLNPAPAGETGRNDVGLAPAIGPGSEQRIVVPPAEALSAPPTDAPNLSALQPPTPATLGELRPAAPPEQQSSVGAQRAGAGADDDDRSIREQFWGEE